MTDLIVVPQAAHWQRLKQLVLDSVSSPITRRVYNLGLDKFFEWYEREPRPGFTKATVCAWRVALEARGLGAVSINVRITAVRKLAVEAADNGLLAPELAAGIVRVKGVASKGVRLGNWLSVRQAQTLLNAPDATSIKGLRDRAILAVLLGCGLRRSEVAALMGMLGPSSAWRTSIMVCSRRGLIRRLGDPRRHQPPGEPEGRSNAGRQLAMENGARRALIPIENRRQFPEVSGDVAERLDPIFYGDAPVAANKALAIS